VFARSPSSLPLRLAGYFERDPRPDVAFVCEPRVVDVLRPRVAAPLRALPRRAADDDLRAPRAGALARGVAVFVALERRAALRVVVERRPRSFAASLRG
jgi:hypothetical protein